MQSKLAKRNQNDARYFHGGSGATKRRSCKRRKQYSSLDKNSKETLPFTDDELMEILVKLPMDSLHRSKCVSKRWLSLISEPQFLHRYINSRVKQDHVLLYSFTYKYGPDFRGDQFGHIDLSMHHVLSNPSLFDSSFKFLPVVRDCPTGRLEGKGNCLSNVEVVGSSNGLFLYKVLFKHKHKPKPKQVRSKRSTLYVCNPLTKGWLELPPNLPRKNGCSTGLTGFFCYPLGRRDPDSDKYSLPWSRVGLTVVQLENPVDSKFVAHVFSSVTGRWSNHRVRGVGGMRFDGTVVAHNGVFFWKAGPVLLAYDPINQPDKCCYIDFPQGTQSHRHSVNSCQGKLLLIDHHDKYKVWELELTEKGPSWNLLHNNLVSQDHDEICLAICSNTNKEIFCFSGREIDHETRRFLLKNAEDWSTVGDFTVQVDKAKGPTFQGMSAHLFSLTAWPTPIPQLPPK